jgi:hypothetical protein
MLCPMHIVEDEDAMQMVWHHDVPVKIDVREISGERPPCRFDDATDCGQWNPIVHNVGENTCPAERTDRDEIRPCITVIKPL